MCALIGVLTLTFPVSIIITNFKQYYRQAYRLASLNDEDLKRAAQEIRAWRLEEAESNNRNGKFELDLPQIFAFVSRFYFNYWVGAKFSEQGKISSGRGGR
jgi:hypothetical protein